VLSDAGVDIEDIADKVTKASTAMDRIFGQVSGS
jgi:hypothetical protein